MPYGYEQPPSAPKKKRVLLAVRYAVLAHTLSVDLQSPDFVIIAPDCNTYASDFDILIMAFEPYSSVERRWFHEAVMPRLKPDAEIRWTN